MGSERCPGSESARAAVKKLAETLGREKSPQNPRNLLGELSQAVDNPATRDDLAVVFLQAGGLPGVVRQLSGFAESSCTADPLVTMSDTVATALSAIFRCTGAIEEAGILTGIVAPLIDAFHARPLSVRRAAAHALCVVAVVQPEQAKAMAEAGVLQLVLAYYSECVDVGYASKTLMPAVFLAQRLVQSQRDAARQLEEAIRAPQIDQAFAALVVLQVCNLMCCVWVPLCLYCINLRQRWQPPCAPCWFLAKKTLLLKGRSCSCVVCRSLHLGTGVVHASGSCVLCSGGTWVQVFALLKHTNHFAWVQASSGWHHTSAQCHLSFIHYFFVLSLVSGLLDMCKE
jgi:hypothetical protein